MVYNYNNNLYCLLLQITSQEVDNVEMETRGQSSKRSWFIYRAGRVTASVIKSAARTNHAMPSESLIKRICYPEAFKFSSVFFKHQEHDGSVGILLFGELQTNVL